MQVKSMLQARQEIVQEGTARDRQTGSGAPGFLRGTFWILLKAYRLQRARLVDRARHDQGWNGATARRNYIGRLKVLLRRLPRVSSELRGGKWGLGRLDFGEYRRTFRAKGVLIPSRPPHAARLRSWCPRKGHHSADGRMTSINGPTIATH